MVCQTVQMECVFIGVSMNCRLYRNSCGAQWYDGLIAIPGCDKNMQVQLWQWDARPRSWFTEVAFIQENGDENHLKLYRHLKPLAKV
jgi:hypothetical protein